MEGTGVFKFTGNFDVGLAAPFDTRIISSTKANLTNATFWDLDDGNSYLYKGLVVSVYSDSTDFNNGLWMLLDEYGHTDVNNWMKIGGTGSFSNTYGTFSQYFQDSDTIDFTEISSSTVSAIVKDDSLQPTHLLTGTEPIEGYILSYTGGSFSWIENTGSGSVTGVTGVTDSTTIDLTLTGKTIEANVFDDSLEPNHILANVPTDGYILSYTSGSFSWIENTGSGSVTGVKYINDETVPVKIGGIEVGENFVAPGYTMQQMWDKLLYPELEGILTAPTLTMILKGDGDATITSNTSKPLYEIGAIISNLYLDGVFDRGSIDPQYDSTSPFRSGLPNTWTFIGEGGLNDNFTPDTDISKTSSQINYTVPIGQKDWTGTIYYDAGVQPKTNKGNDFDSFLSAGDIGYARSIIGVYPVYATTVDHATLTKQALVNIAGPNKVTVSMVPDQGTQGGNKQTFQFASVYGDITLIEQYNTVSETWQLQAP